MKKYIKFNLKPILLGFSVAVIFSILLNVIESIIMKIAILINTL